MGKLCAALGASHRRIFQKKLEPYTRQWVSGLQVTAKTDRVGSVLSRGLLNSPSYLSLPRTFLWSQCRSFASQVVLDDDDEDDEFPPQAEDEKVEAVALTLVKTLMKARGETTAVEKLKEWQSPPENHITRPLLDILISKLVRQSQSQIALEICEWMLREKPVELKETDKSLYLAVVCKTADLNKIEAVVDTFEPAEKTEKVYSNILRAYASKDNKLSEAETAFRVLKENYYPTKPHAFNRMMLMYIRLKMYEKAVEMYSEMRKLKVEPNLFTYHTLLRIEEHLGNMKMEVRKNAKAKLDDIEPSNRIKSTISRMLSMYAILGDAKGVEEMWTLLTKYKLRFDQTEKLGIHAFQMIGKADKVEKIFQASKEPYKLYHHMIRFYAALGRLDKAKKLLPKETKCGKPSYTHFNYVILAYLNQKNPVEAFEILKLAVQRISDYSTPEFYETFVRVMSGFVEKKDIGRGEELLKLCIGKRCARDAQVFNELLKVYCNAKVPVTGILKRMKDARAEPNQETKLLLEQLSAYESSSSSSAAPTIKN